MKKSQEETETISVSKVKKRKLNYDEPSTKFFSVKTKKNFQNTLF